MLLCFLDFLDILPPNFWYNLKERARTLIVQHILFWQLALRWFNPLCFYFFGVKMWFLLERKWCSLNLCDRNGFEASGEIKVQYGSGWGEASLTWSLLWICRITNLNWVQHARPHLYCFTGNDEEMWRKQTSWFIESNHLLFIDSLPFPCCTGAQIIHKVVVLGNQCDCNTAN